MDHYLIPTNPIIGAVVHKRKQNQTSHKPTKFQITGEIVGGPHDGKTLTYFGTSELPLVDVFDKMDKFRFQNHNYKIVDIDRDKMHVVLMW